MIFVDTGAWFAFCVPCDVDHVAATQFAKNNSERFVTTDYVLDELLTLLKARGEFERALRIGPELMAGNTARFELVQESDLKEAWTVYKRFRDKLWSFTDCVSYAVMQRLDIKTAFAFDEHFRQFGTVDVVPR